MSAVVAMNEETRRMEQFNDIVANINLLMTTGKGKNLSDLILDVAAIKNSGFNPINTYFPLQNFGFNLCNHSVKLRSVERNS